MSCGFSRFSRVPGWNYSLKINVHFFPSYMNWVDLSELEWVIPLPGMILYTPSPPTADTPRKTNKNALGIKPRIYIQTENYPSRNSPPKKNKPKAEKNQAEAGSCCGSAGERGASSLRLSHYSYFPVYYSLPPLAPRLPRPPRWTSARWRPSLTRIVTTRAAVARISTRWEEKSVVVVGFFKVRGWRESRDFWWGRIMPWIVLCPSGLWRRFHRPAVTEVGSWVFFPQWVSSVEET